MQTNQFQNQVQSLYPISMASPQTSEEEYRSAFVQYLTNGFNKLHPQQRSLIESRAGGISGLQGGAIVPSSLVREIEIALKSYGGLFQVAHLFETADGGTLTMPTVNDSNQKAVIVNEYEQTDKRTVVFSSVSMRAFTYRTPIIPVSLELMQDSYFELEPFLAALLSESLWRGVHADMTVGDGLKEPQGIVGAATECKHKAAPTTITTDDLMTMLPELDSNYRKRATWMFNAATYWELRKLKDNTGKYIWQESISEDHPSQLLGLPYVINDDMANVGSGNASVLLGDFSKYKIRLVSDIKVIRLDELLAEYLAIGMMGFARLDGRLVDAGTHPVMKLTHRTA